VRKILTLRDQHKVHERERIMLPVTPKKKIAIIAGALWIREQAEHFNS